MRVAVAGLQAVQRQIQDERADQHEQQSLALLIMGQADRIHLRQQPIAAKQPEHRDKQIQQSDVQRTA
jgi:hypothetical protein